MTNAKAESYKGHLIEPNALAACINVKKDGKHIYQCQTIAEAKRAIDELATQDFI